MTTQHPTPADIKTLADNMRAEGQTSRADVLDNVAKEMAALFLYVERLRTIEAAAKKIIVIKPYLEYINDETAGDLVRKLAAALASEPKP